MYYYLDEDGNRHSYLPRIWKGLTPFTEALATAKGWMRIDQIDPVPEPPDYTERNAAERAIVAEICDLARRYGALEELARLDDVSIPSLESLAERYGVTAGDMMATTSRCLIGARHLEAITGGTWGEAWEGLKERFSLYFTEIIQGGDKHED